MPTPFTIKVQTLPEERDFANFMVEGHVFQSDTDLPWLAHLVMYRTSQGRTRLLGLSRDELAALLRFVAENDPDIYERAGQVGADRRRRNNT